MDFIQRGIWAGIMATSSMSLSMFKLFQILPFGEKSPLPPADLTQQFMKPLGIDNILSGQQRVDLTLFSHYGYGVACGILYASTQRSIKGSAMVKGGLFGLGVWAASYMGWIPALRFNSSAYNMPPKKNALMIFSHLVWGASLGVAEERLRNSAHQMLDGKRSPSQQLFA